MDWSQKKSWGAAYEDCIARGGDLVSIHSYEEEEFLSQYSKGSSKWIGLKHNPTEGGEWDEGFKGSTPVEGHSSYCSQHLIITIT